VLTAPDKSFELNSSNVEEWPKLSIQKEFKVSKEKFLEFTSKYRELLEKLEEKDTDIEKQNYYLMTTAFQIEEPLFKNK
jgi:uncharacterized protein YjbK